MNPIVYAIPVFFALMALEWAVAHARGQRAFRLGDTINSVGLGAISQISGLYARLLGFGPVGQFQRGQLATASRFAQFVE